MIKTHSNKVISVCNEAERAKALKAPQNWSQKCCLCGYSGKGPVHLYVIKKMWCGVAWRGVARSSNYLISEATCRSVLTQWKGSRLFAHFHLKNVA